MLVVVIIVGIVAVGDVGVQSSSSLARSVSIADPAFHARRPRAVTAGRRHVELRRLSLSKAVVAALAVRWPHPHQTRSG